MVMKDNKVVNIVFLIVGLILVAISLFMSNSIPKNVGGLCIGIGSGLVGMSCAKLFLAGYFKRNPEASELNMIEESDERNMLIRYKARAESGKITHWLIIVLALVTILLKAPLWVTLIGVGLFILQDIMYFFFIHKFSKLM